LFNLVQLQLSCRFIKIFTIINQEFISILKDQKIKDYILSLLLALDNKIYKNILFYKILGEPHLELMDYFI